MPVTSSPSDSLEDIQDECKDYQNHQMDQALCAGMKEVGCEVCTSTSLKHSLLGYCRWVTRSLDDDPTEEGECVAFSDIPREGAYFVRECPSKAVVRGLELLVVACVEMLHLLL
jgi:hypothetical protein